MHCFVGNLFRCKSAKNLVEISQNYIKFTSSKWKCAGFLGHPVYLELTLTSAADCNHWTTSQRFATLLSLRRVDFCTTAESNEQVTLLYVGLSTCVVLVMLCDRSGKHHFRDLQTIGNDVRKTEKV